MAIISYSNVALPVGGLGFIPAFEEVLDTTPTVGAATAGVYQLVNNNDGPFNGFKIQFESNVNGGGDFIYTNVGGVMKPAGTITFLFLRAPDGSFIAAAGPGTTGFGNAKLQDFYAALTNAAAATPKDAILAALDGLFSKSNVINGSPVADHLTAYGSSVGEVFGGGGNDVLWSRKHYDRKMVGGDGNDIIRVEDGDYEVLGANPDGTGGAGQTDTLEIVGYVGRSSHPSFDKLTNIDVLRFVAGDQPAPGAVNGAAMGANFDLTKIGVANLPSALTVHGSTTASPFSENYIGVYSGYDQAATKGMTINLSGWTFRTWDEERNYVNISTNSAQKALKDIVVGTKVADQIDTYRGDDTIRGGGGADEMHGGDGNDIFVYGSKEAVGGEHINGGDPAPQGPLALIAQSSAGGTDTVLVLADNDFSGVIFDLIERLKFGGKATATFEQDIVGNPEATIIGDGNVNTVSVQLKNTAGKIPGVDLSALTFQSWTDGVDKVVIRGTKSQDIITGSSRGDVVAGGEGRDSLQGGTGADAFLFDAGMGNGVDQIADFSRKQGDMIWFDLDVFSRLKSAAAKGSGVLKKSAFEIGRKADDKKDRVLYDKKDGTLRYDDDGSGKHKARVIAEFDDSPALKAGDIFVI